MAKATALGTFKAKVFMYECIYLSINLCKCLTKNNIKVNETIDFQV